MNDGRAILTLPIAVIAIPSERIGYFNRKHADRLAQEIARDGQHDPIHVQNNDGGNWTLVAGLHRLRAVEAIGRDNIDAIQVADSSATPDDLARLELSENLDHQHRRPIERAIFMARLARIEEDRDHPGRVGESHQARGGRAKAASITMMEAGPGWRQRTADALDCSIPTLERYQRIYRNIVERLPEHHERINFHPLCNRFAAVNAIAQRESQSEREKIAAVLLDGTDWQSMDAVMSKAGVKTSTGVRATSKMMHEWSRSTPNERLAHVGFIGDEMTAIEARHVVSRLRKRGLLDIHQR